jgi:hypothetical protein
MMEFILIAHLYNVDRMEGVKPLAVIVQEFKSKEACDKAMEIIKGRILPHDKYSNVVCVEK